MKIILVIFLFITSSQCGVVKDGLSDNNTAECHKFEIKIIRVIDSYVDENRTFLTDIFIDITKDHRATNVETDTSKLPSGVHKWEMIFLTTEPEEEINRIISIVEKAAYKIGSVSGKNCTTEDITRTVCTLNITIAGTN